MGRCRRTVWIFSFLLRIYISSNVIDALCQQHLVILQALFVTDIHLLHILLAIDDVIKYRNYEQCQSD